MIGNRNHIPKNVSDRKTVYAYGAFTCSVLLTVLLFLSTYTSYWRVEQLPFCFASLVFLLAALILCYLRVQLWFSALDVAVILYFLYCLSSTFLLAYPFWPSDRLYILGGYTIYYFVSRKLMEKPIDQVHFLFAVLVLAVSESVLGMAQLLGPAAVNSGPYFRVHGTFNNPGMLGGFVAAGLPVSVFFIRYFQNRRWALYMFCLTAVIIVAGLLVSASRTAMVAAVAGTCIFLFFGPGKIRFTIPGSRKPLLISVAILFSSLLFYLLVRFNTSSITGRFLIWRISWDMVLDHPFFGLGYGRFAVEYGNYQAFYFATHAVEERLVQLAGMNYLAFCEPLKILAEHGVIGLGLFFLVAYRIFTVTDKAISQKSVSSQPFIAVTSVILVFSLFSYPFDSIPISLLLYTSIAVISNGSKKITFARIRIGRLGRLGTVLVILLFTFRSGQKIVSLEVWQHAQHRLLYSPGSSRSGYERALSVLSNNAAFLHNYGAELTEDGDFSKALEILNRTGRYGNSVELHSYMARCYIAMNKNEGAEIELRKAANMDPKLFKPLDNLLEFYINTGEDSKAKKIAEDICRKPIKVPSKDVDQIRTRARVFIGKANKH